MKEKESAFMEEDMEDTMEEFDMELTAEIEADLGQFVKEFAQKGRPQTDLFNILVQQTKTWLAQWAGAFKIAGRSKMSKDELAEALVPYIASRQAIVALFAVEDEERTTLFELAASSNKPLQLVNSQLLRVERFCRRMLAVVYEEKGSYILLVPDQVKQVLNEIGKQELRKIKRHYKLYRQYILAFTNLYGAFKPQQLRKVFEEQQKMDGDELEQFAIDYAQQSSYCAWQEPYIVSSYFEDEETDAELQEMLKKRIGKPSYLPKAQELLKYADDFYYEITPQLQTLHDYLSEFLCEDKGKLEELMDEIQFICSIDADMKEIMEVFGDFDIVFQSSEQVHLITTLINEVYNHTRIWSNAGYTPYEMHEWANKEMPKHLAGSAMPALLNISRPQPATAGTATTVAPKVGRNDPCPCGSGKKYKKCCLT